MANITKIVEANKLPSKGKSLEELANDEEKCLARIKQEIALATEKQYLVDRHIGQTKTITPTIDHGPEK